MKRWILIFAVTVILGNLLAQGLNKLMPNTVGPIFESLNVNKLVQLLEKKNSDQTIEDESQKQNKKLAQNKIIFPQLPTKSPLIKKNDKKSQLVAAKEEEKKRRKKRKKKEEKAHDKKPTLTVTKVAETKPATPKIEEHTATGILISTVENKKEEKPEAKIPEEEKIDLKYWAKLLNDEPTAENLKKFVGLYKSRKINTKAYYSVLNSLIGSSNKEARRLAVLGSSIEPSPLAFEILANIKHTEKEPELQTLVAARLEVFKDVKYLEFLIQPLKSADLFTKLEATSLVGQIVVSFNTEAVTNEIQLSLNIIASILKSYTQNSNAQLQSLSGQALNVINRLLGNIA